MTDIQNDLPGQNRRAVLRAGMIGAAWVVPAVTMIGVSPAHADNPSGGQLPEVKPETPPQPVVPQPPTQPQAAAPVRQVTQNRGAVAADTSGVQGAQAEQLARTGSDMGVAAAVGAGLLAGGAAVVAASRKMGTTEAGDA